MDDLLIRTLLAALAFSCLCGPMGCLVVWQRMAYFGATLSHSAILGVVVGLLYKLNFYFSLLIVCSLVSILLWLIDKNPKYNTDTFLGILSHCSLALGVLALGFLPQYRIDLMGYLFGDILLVSWDDIAIIFGLVTIIGLLLVYIWRPLVSLIVQRDLALADGVKESRLKLIFLLLLSTTIAITIQIAGVLLIVSLLIIPAATARPFSRTPEHMALLAIALAIVSSITGIFISFHFDSAAGPSIVVATGALFFISLIFSKTLNFRKI